jgi:hypothetical protein
MLEYAIVYFGCTKKNSRYELLDNIVFKNIDDGILKLTFRDKETYAKGYHNIKPDGLCWLRAFFHVCHKYDPDITDVNQREAFIKFIRDV